MHHLIRYATKISADGEERAELLIESLEYVAQAVEFGLGLVAVSIRRHWIDFGVFSTTRLYSSLQRDCHKAHSGLRLLKQFAFRGFPCQP